MLHQVPLPLFHRIPAGDFIQWDTDTWVAPVDPGGVVQVAHVRDSKHEVHLCAVGDATAAQIYVRAVKSHSPMDAEQAWCAANPDPSTQQQCPFLLAEMVVAVARANGVVYLLDPQLL